MRHIPFVGGRGAHTGGGERVAAVGAERKVNRERGRRGGKPAPGYRALTGANRGRRRLSRDNCRLITRRDEHAHDQALLCDLHGRGDHDRALDDREDALPRGARSIPVRSNGGRRRADGGDGMRRARANDLFDLARCHVCRRRGCEARIRRLIHVKHGTVRKPDRCELPAAGAQRVSGVDRLLDRSMPCFPAGRRHGQPMDDRPNRPEWPGSTASLKERALVCTPGATQSAVTTTRSAAENAPARPHRIKHVVLPSRGL